MTSVENALSYTREEAVVVSTPIPRVRVETSTAAMPRVSPSLEHRLQWERAYRVRLGATDAAVIVIAAGITAGTQLQLGEPPAHVVLRGALIAVAWFAMLLVMRTPHAALFRTSAEEYRGIAHASGLAIGLVAVAAVLFDWDSMRLTVLITLPCGLPGLLMSRWAWRRWLRSQRRHGRLTSRTLVVGNRDEVEYVASVLAPLGTAAGYQVVGATLLDENARELSFGGAPVPVLGNLNTVAQVASDLSADTIIVAGRPERDPDFVKRLGWQLEGTAAELVLSNRLADVAGPRLSFAPVDGLPLIKMQIPTYEGGRHALKRVLDIVVAAFALVPIVVITPLLALLIKIDSPGPVFFFQERVGRDGRRFQMVKFRSMHPDAEAKLAALKAANEGSGLLFKMKNDPRVTRVGRVLRKLSLDELPQFWNVLAGDMSVVGPRPPLPSEVGDYDGTISRRLYIKPGITGLWQVSGRSDLSWDESIRLDLRYVENWSVITDLQIMWRTARVMFGSKGAY
ncbi:sugar transferase [Microbacterium sp. nov. GSS16]|uniref:sugar transferase n=1 Tax=Microbacterium sp. nov. GSS16 TaxID=3019890 RepID=UPI0023050846|nr:sugar transferase [Microbacterium sp. nov. GSS16]WCD92904.1 sugar transferase [Microbacterium sp. nov. GSS16]